MTKSLLERARAIEACANTVRDCACPDCDGAGYVSVPAERKRYDCDECRGTGTLHRSDIEARVRALSPEELTK